MRDLWRAVFGNHQPVEVEIGPGTGTFLLTAAERNPHINFFGMEHSHSRAAHLATAIAARRLGNAQAIVADGACVVATLIPPESVAAYHIYFPDPWWKRRHHRRRLFTPAFGAALFRTLAPGGRIHVATDVDDVFTLALRTLTACDGLARHPDWPSPRTGCTVFERKGLARGATTHEATFVKHAMASSGRRAHTSNAAPMTPAESPS